jgi:GST-like protein
VSVIRLYTWGTPNGNKLHIMLEELGLKYELIPVNLAKREQYDPAFLKINPNGKVPAIVDSDGPNGRSLALAESGAILIYLGEKTGRFIPQDAHQRLAMLQWIMFQMAHVGPMIGQLHYFMASAPPGNDYGVERYRKEGERLMNVLDNRLKESTYIANADYTIADICTWPWIRSWVHTTKQSLGDRPALTRWYDEIERRPAVRKAVEIYNQLRASAKN